MRIATIHVRRTGAVVGLGVLFIGILVLLCAVPGARAAVEPTFNDPYYSKQWYLKQINASEAWQITAGSPDVVVAIIDSGVDIDHPDLSGAIWKNTAEVPGDGIDNDHDGYVDNVHGWDFVTNSADVRPKFIPPFSKTGLNHGTIVAGIIAAQGQNGEGIVGLAWKVKIMPLRVLDGLGRGRSLDVVHAVDFAVAHHVDVINLSFVGVVFDSSLNDAIERAYKAGIIVVASSGNEEYTFGGEGRDLDVKPAYPVCYNVAHHPHIVLGVAATDPIDQVTKFSNISSHCISIVAPGTGFFGTEIYKSEFGFDSPYGGLWSGTSVAAPIVSATVALLRSVDKTLSPDAIFGILQKTAVDITSLNYRIAGKFGVGRVNVGAAVKRAYTQAPKRYQSVIIDSAPTLTARQLVISVSGGELPRADVLGADAKLALRFALWPSGGQHVTVSHRIAQRFVSGVISGGGPLVRVFNGQGKLTGQFYAFNPSNRDGIRVGELLDGTDGTYIVAAPIRATQANVKVFRTNGELINEFPVGDVDTPGALTLATGTIRDNIEGIVIATSRGGGTHWNITTYDPQGNQLHTFVYADAGPATPPAIVIGTFPSQREAVLFIAPSAIDARRSILVMTLDGKLVKRLTLPAALASRAPVQLSIQDLIGDSSKELIVAPRDGTRTSNVWVLSTTTAKTLATLAVDAVDRYLNLGQY